MHRRTYFHPFKLDGRIRAGLVIGRRSRYGLDGLFRPLWYRARCAVAKLNSFGRVAPLLPARIGRGAEVARSASARAWYLLPGLVVPPRGEVGSSVVTAIRPLQSGKGRGGSQISGRR